MIESYTVVSARRSQLLSYDAAMFRVVVADPDPYIRASLQSHCRSSQVRLSFTTTMEQTLMALTTQPFHGLVAELQFSDGAVSSLLEQLKQTHRHLPTVVWSKRFTEASRLDTLKQGADILLTKPISPREFELQLERLAGFSKHSFEPKLKVGALELCEESGELRVGNFLLQLRAKETQIMRCLMHRANQVVLRDHIVSYVWPTGEVVPERVTLDVYIRRLRLLLGNHASSLETVRGFGYRLVGATASTQWGLDQADGRDPKPANRDLDMDGSTQPVSIPVAVSYEGDGY